MSEGTEAADRHRRDARAARPIEAETPATCCARMAPDTAAPDQHGVPGVHGNALQRCIGFSCVAGASTSRRASPSRPAFCAARTTLVSMWPSAEPTLGPKVALFVHFDRQGAVREYVLHYLAALQAAGYDIAFVTNSGRLQPEAMEALQPLCAAILIRRNVGYDFGAMREGLLRLRMPRQNTEQLLLVNDSVYGPRLARSTRCWSGSISTSRISGARRRAGRRGSICNRISSPSARRRCATALAVILAARAARGLQGVGDLSLRGGADAAADPRRAARARVLALSGSRQAGRSRSC